LTVDEFQRLEGIAKDFAGIGFGERIYEQVSDAKQIRQLNLALQWTEVDI
jgi:hypothetical protein